MEKCAGWVTVSQWQLLLVIFYDKEASKLLALDIRLEKMSECYNPSNTTPVSSLIKIYYDNGAPWKESIYSQLECHNSISYGFILYIGLHIL